MTLRGGETIGSSNVVWVTGTWGAPLAAAMGLDVAPDGRIPVGRTLQLGGCPEAYAIGDITVLGDQMAARIRCSRRSRCSKERSRGLQHPARGARRAPPLRFRLSRPRHDGDDRPPHGGGAHFRAAVQRLLRVGPVAGGYLHLLAIIGLRNRALVLLN